MASIGDIITERLVIGYDHGGSGAILGAHVEASEVMRVDATGKPTLVIPAPTRPVAVSDITAELPAHAALLAQIATLTAERDAARTIRTSVRTALGLPEDATDEQITAAVTAAHQAVARVAELEAQIAAQQPSAVRVTPYQARRALRDAGLLAQVEAIVAAAQADSDIRLAWDWAVEWRRDSEMIAQLGAALGLSAEQIDALFASAAAIAG